MTTSLPGSYKAMSKAAWDKVQRACRMPLIYRNWLDALLNRFGPPSRDGAVTYILRSGAAFRMQAGSHDIRVLNEVWLDRVYEPDADFSVREGWTVLDLGAHKGSFAVRAALAGPKTRVHAVEPEPENLRYLNANIALNRLENVVVHAAAVSADPGEALLYVGGHRGSGTNSLLRERVKGDKGVSVAVPTIRLDDLLERAGGAGGPDENGRGGCGICGPARCFLQGFTAHTPDRPRISWRHGA